MDGGQQYLPQDRPPYEPTSGVDPIARDAFWQILVELARQDHVTIFISTHFMNEAERCDRIALMHAGKVLVSDTPGNITRERGAATLEDAFIGYLEDATSPQAPAEAKAPVEPARIPVGSGSARLGRFFDVRRMLAYLRRESLELRRDPIRLSLALFGSVFLMFVVAYGINLDVDNLTFAVLDRDQTSTSENYILNLAGSRYFVEHAPITDYAELDRRMRNGELSLAIEIPPHFGRDLARGSNVEVAAWMDGSMPTRGETVRGYIQGIHAAWIADQLRIRFGERAATGPFRLEVRYRYNPGVESLVAIAPAIIPLLLMLIPSMLSALSVVREKELGSIINLYATPVTRLEFLLGKQTPYIALSMASFLLLWAFAVGVFRVPFTGSGFAFTLGALLYLAAATGIGLVMSSFTRTQVAAIFGTAILTIVPAVQFCGLTDPVSSLQGAGAVVGRIFPTTYFVTIARGTFSKGLGLGDLSEAFLPLLMPCQCCSASARRS